MQSYGVPVRGDGGPNGRAQHVPEAVKGSLVLRQFHGRLVEGHALLDVVIIAFCRAHGFQDLPVILRGLNSIEQSISL